MSIDCNYSEGHDNFLTFLVDAATTHTGRRSTLVQSAQRPTGVSSFLFCSTVTASNQGSCISMCRLTNRQPS